MPAENICYGDKYQDDCYEYRNVKLPSELAKLVPRNHLMNETEWRNLGVQQSPGESLLQGQGESELFFCSRLDPLHVSCPGAASSIVQKAKKLMISCEAL